MYKRISGEVVHGKKLGRKIGFPTANISLKKELGLPAATYEVNGLIGKRVFRGVATYRAEIELFEAHFFDFSENIYGREIEILVYKKIRDNMKFQSLEEIQKQIEKDVKYSKSHHHSVLSFGTFDVFHPGHEYYLNQSKMYGNQLVCIVSTSQNRKKIAGDTPTHTLDVRWKEVENSGIPDIVEKGSEKNPLQWIDMYSPQVICLGYDQHSFLTELEAYIKKNAFPIDIIRIPSYKPDIYKSSKLKKQNDENSRHP